MKSVTKLSILFLENHIYVSTQNDHGGHNNNHFSLVSALANHTTFGILCEKGKKALTWSFIVDSWFS